MSKSVWVGSSVVESTGLICQRSAVQLRPNLPEVRSGCQLLQQLAGRPERPGVIGLPGESPREVPDKPILPRGVALRFNSEEPDHGGNETGAGSSLSQRKTAASERRSARSSGSPALGTGNGANRHGETSLFPTGGSTGSQPAQLKQKGSRCANTGSPTLGGYPPQSTPLFPSGQR